MYKALIVDDEKPVRIAISKLGHWNHYHIKLPEMTSNGQEALSVMREIRPDLVFVPQNFPKAVLSLSAATMILPMLKKRSVTV